MTQTRFSGSFTRIARQMLIVLAPLAAAVCLMLFGPPGLRIFVLSLAMAPVLLLLAFAIARVDQLAFDYEHNRWLRPLRRPLPADSIASVQLVETLGLIQATARTHRGSSEMLLAGLPAARGAELVRAIENSSRTAQVTSRRVSVWKPALAPALVVGLPHIGAIAYHHRKTPAAATGCTAENWPAGTRGTTTHQLGGASFSLPGSFQLTERRSGQLHFRTQEGIDLVVAPGSDPEPGGRAGAVFLRAAGLRTEHELYRYACCTRFAIIPLLLKRVVLSGAHSTNLTVYRDSSSTAALVIETGSRTRILTSEPPLHIVSSAPLADPVQQQILGAIGRPDR
ncbi:MAG: hypothetical protein GY953_50945 [bacterium]|nr:hypothetical protein [bacterium]